MQVSIIKCQRVGRLLKPKASKSFIVEIYAKNLIKSNTGRKVRPFPWN